MIVDLFNNWNVISANLIRTVVGDPPRSQNCRRVLSDWNWAHLGNVVKVVVLSSARQLIRRYIGCGLLLVQSKGKIFSTISPINKIPPLILKKIWFYSAQGLLLVPKRRHNFRVSSVSPLRRIYSAGAPGYSIRISSINCWIVFNSFLRIAPVVWPNFNAALLTSGPKSSKIRWLRWSE